MINKRKSGRTLKNIGIRWYNFDFQLEKNIYCYLCCNKIERRKLKKLDEKLKFVSYSQWKQYICNKYENYNSDELKEFDRYLNQIMRNINPTREYIRLFIPVIITLVITKVAEVFYSIHTAELNSLLSVVIIEPIFSVFVIIPAALLLIETFIPIREDNVDENFLKDYKEIIDEIIKSKRKMQSFR